MTKRIEYSILAAFVALAYAVVKVALPDFPVTEQALLAGLIYVLMKLSVEVIGKPVVARLFPRAFRRIHTPPE